MESLCDSVPGMRLRRRFAEYAGVLIVPAICLTFTGYFAYSGIVGPRGIFAWHRTTNELAMARHDLSDLQSKREALAHRIALLDDQAIDPDLLAEVARSVLAEGRPGEVVIPREKH